MGVVITTGERGVRGFERGVWGWFGAGDNLATMSVGTGIVPINQLSEEKCDH
jgi:hypothetical protein